MTGSEKSVSVGDVWRIGGGVSHPSGTPRVGPTLSILDELLPSSLCHYGVRSQPYFYLKGDGLNRSRCLVGTRNPEVRGGRVDDFLLTPTGMRLHRVKSQVRRRLGTCTTTDLSPTSLV